MKQFLQTNNTTTTKKTATAECARENALRAIKFRPLLELDLDALVEWANGTGEY